MASEIYYLVKELGFPIAMCIYFIWINNTTIKSNTEALVKLKEHLMKRKC